MHELRHLDDAQRPYPPRDASCVGFVIAHEQISRPSGRLNVNGTVPTAVSSR